jgi:8-oxo-dGTP diphosphatase
MNESGASEKSPPRPTILVAAAVIVEDGRVLLSRRKKGTHLAGAWEFPGGKVEPNEDPKDALTRELHEELGIDARATDILECTFHRYDDAKKSVLLLFYRAARTDRTKEPTPLDVAEVKWAMLADLHDADFPPADTAVLTKVRALLEKKPSFDDLKT